MAFTFLNVFLVKESYDCVATNPNLACFTVNTNSSITERVNCSTIDSTFNGTVPDLQCYEFVFKVSAALSDAGGILTIGGVAFAAIATFILFISKGEEGCESKRRCCCTICIQVIMFVSIFAVIILLPFIGIIDNGPGNTSTIFELIILGTIVVNTIAIPWHQFERAETEIGDSYVSGAVNLSPRRLPTEPL